MDILNKNVLLKILLENRLKPDFNKFAYEELYQMCIDFINDNVHYLSQSKYSPNTINLINSICQKMDIIENNNDNDENTEKNLKKIIDWINDLWKKLPLLNNNLEIIDCGICLGFITNCDYICFQCEHLTHSSCFLNYLFSNIKNDTNKLLNLFRCPNCRNYLTSNIQTCAQEFSNSENDIDDYEYNNSDNNENYNIITQQYNLTENSIDNYLNNYLNNLFEHNRYNINLNNNLIDNIILNNCNINISDSNSDCDHDSNSDSNNSFDLDTDFSDI